MRSTRPCGRDVQQPGEPVVGGDVADVQQLRGRFEALGPHVLGVRGELQRLRHLGLGDEGALALDALQAALDHQLLQGLAHRRARGVELGGQGALRRDRCARRLGPGHVEQMLLQTVVLGHARGTDGRPTLVLRTADVGAHALPSRLRVPKRPLSLSATAHIVARLRAGMAPARSVIPSVYPGNTLGLVHRWVGRRWYARSGASPHVIRWGWYTRSRSARTVACAMKGPCISRSHHGGDDWV